MGRRGRAAALLGAVVTLGCASAASYAGEAAIDNDGNFLTVDADLSPPVAGTKSRPQPVTLTIDQMYGNYRTGKQPPLNTTIAVQLPRGLTTHPEFVGACPLPKSDADIKASRCSASARVGIGTALADARSLGLNDPVPAKVTAFNGEKNAAGNSTLILFGEAAIGGNTVTVEYDFELKKAAAPFGTQLVTFDPYAMPPPDPNAGFITLNKLDVQTGKTVTRKLRGKRVKRGYLEAPTTCPRAGWAFGEDFALVTGATLKAPDFVSCVK
jgi:hypothetical protein